MKKQTQLEVAELYQQTDVCRRFHESVGVDKPFIPKTPEQYATYRHDEMIFKQQLDRCLNYVERFKEFRERIERR